MNEQTVLTLPVVCTRGMIVFPGKQVNIRCWSSSEFKGT